MAVATQREQWDASRVNGFIPHISSSSSFFYAYTTPCAFSNDIRHTYVFSYTLKENRVKMERNPITSRFFVCCVTILMLDSLCP